MEKTKEKTKKRVNIDWLPVAIGLGLLNAALAYTVFTNLKLPRAQEVAIYGAVAALCNINVVLAIWKSR